MEIEWLEQIMGFMDGLFGGLVQWSWASEGTLSDTIGRHRAKVVWVAIGFPGIIVGCSMALRITSVRRRAGRPAVSSRGERRGVTTCPGNGGSGT